MKKMKWIHMIIVVCFVFITGILYTVTFIKPWKRKGILLNGDKASVEAIVTEPTPPVTENEVAEAIHVSDNSVNDQDTSVELRNLYIHICGAVKEPGVYEVKDGGRLFDVTLLAGGLNENAAKDFINLAQLVVDGCQYYIPTLTEVEGLEKFDPNDSSSMGTTDGSNIPSSDQETSDDHLVNINTATKDELMTLKGVGETRADTIITYREQIGSFETIEDIMKVTGIKEGLFQKIKDDISVN